MLLLFTTFGHVSPGVFMITHVSPRGLRNPNVSLHLHVGM